jgi:uncharacterized protein YdeI (YjbR/CyaY-like superfamily)
MNMEKEMITVFSRNEFRKWLRKNFKKERAVSVILYKKHTGKKTVSHKELMEEAICFGWIDTTIKRLDEDRFVRNFAKRNKNSKWSDNTLRYGAELLKKGRMSKFGIKMYELGKGKKTHDYGIPKNPKMPKDLKLEFDKKGNRKAKENFERFSKSHKRMIYRWFLSGKRNETREKRIKLILKNSKEGNGVFT